MSVVGSFSKARSYSQTRKIGNLDVPFCGASGPGVLDSARMRRPSLILISPNIEKKGDEFGDLSTSLSETYQDALMSAGAIPLGMPATTSPELIADCVTRCDGVLLTGGEDVDPRIYSNGLSPRLQRTVTITGDG